MNCQKFLVLALVTTAALPPPTVGAAPINLDVLVSNSPFSGPAAPATVNAKTDPVLEFRGMFVDRGEAFFSLYDVSARSALWVGLNEPGNPFVVQSYDDTQGQVTVQFQGKILNLPLKQAKVIAAAAVASVPAGARQGPANTTPGVTPAAPVEETNRLAAVAEEIRRRRAARQPAAQATPAATPPN